MSYPSIITDYLTIKSISGEIKEFMELQRLNNVCHEDMFKSYNKHDLLLLYKLISFNRINKYDFSIFQWKEGENKIPYFKKLIDLYNSYSVPIDIDIGHIIVDILNTNFDTNPRINVFLSNYEDLYKYHHILNDYKIITGNIY